MTVLSKAIKRSVKIHGIEGMVNITISQEGLRFVIPGTKQAVLTDWGTVIRNCSTDTNVPSYLFGQPLELLKSVALKKRADKGGK